MRPYDVVMMPVIEILRTAVDSVDFGMCYEPGNPDVSARWWEDIIRTKAADSGFGGLLNAIMANGFDPNSPIGFSNGCITEGHHRLTAAILLCLDEIPVSAYGGGTGELCAHDCAGDDWCAGHPVETYALELE